MITDMLWGVKHLKIPPRKYLQDSQLEPGLYGGWELGRSGQSLLAKETERL